MAKIRLLTSAVGDDFTWSPGEEVEVDEATARKWADGERAVRVDQSRGERAVAEPVGEAPVVEPSGETAVASPSGEQATAGRRPRVRR